MIYLKRQCVNLKFIFSRVTAPLSISSANMRSSTILNFLICSLSLVKGSEISKGLSEMSLDDSSSVPPPPPPETEIGRPLLLTKDYYAVEEEELGGFKNFGRKYLTLRIPNGQEAAEEYSLKLKRFVEALKPYVWSFDDDFTPDELRLNITGVLSNFPEFRSQAIRRSLIYGLLSRFRSIKKHYENEPKVWRFMGRSMAEGLRTVNEMIPEVFFDMSPEALLEDSNLFVHDVNIAIAHSFAADFSPIIDVLKEMKYAAASNNAPLVILINKEEYDGALKMLAMKEARLHPKQNPQAWLAMIKANETTKKQIFIWTLVKKEWIDLNWTYNGLDAVQLAIKSKHKLLNTILGILNLGKMKKSIDFYLQYAMSQEVLDAHVQMPTYQELLERRLRLMTPQYDNPVSRGI